MPDSDGVDFYHKQGNLYPPYRGAISDANGPVNLTAATALKFRMWDRRSQTIVIDDQDADVTDAPAGEFKYDWQAGDTDESGFYLAEVDITLPAGTFTFPNPGWIVIQITERGPIPAP